MHPLIARFRILGSELVLGTLVALLSIGTAYFSYTGAMADSDQNKYEIMGMKALNDGNTEYLQANQDVTQDFNYFDNWAVNIGVDDERAQYYYEQMSPELISVIESGSDTAWEDYSTNAYALPTQLFERSEAAFALGNAYDEMGDSLQLVMLYMGLGLAFAAWASLLNEESNLRPLFGLFAILALIMALFTYFGIPPIPTIEIPADPYAG